jgi:hypothetical protein
VKNPRPGTKPPGLFYVKAQAQKKRYAQAISSHELVPELVPELALNGLAEKRLEFRFPQTTATFGLDTPGSPGSNVMPFVTIENESGQPDAGRPSIDYLLPLGIR